VREKEREECVLFSYYEKNKTCNLVIQMDDRCKNLGCGKEIYHFFFFLKTNQMEFKIRPYN
jgi:hypothetical protein